MSGEGLKKKHRDFGYDTATFVVGFVPYVGTALSIYSYVHDICSGFGNQYYFYPESYEFNNELNIYTSKTNSTDQIAAYGNLIKSQSVKLTANAAKPRLIHVGGGYVEAKYVIARKSGSTYNDIRVVTSISVSVVEDDTSTVWGNGDIIDFGRATGTYETSTFARLDNISLSGGTSVTIPATSQRKVIKIVPKLNGTYKIFTSGVSGDPHFRITNATTGAAAVVAIDDIDGANNRNATLTLDLVNGNIYYLEAFCYSTPYSYTLHMGYAPEATQVLALNSPYSVTLSNYTYQMVKFTPTVSGYYEFLTNRTSGDPQLFLFYSDGTLLGSDDDSGGSMNALLNCYLTAGNTYYIAMQGHIGLAAAFSITATRR